MRLRGWDGIWRFRERMRTIGVFCSRLGVASDKGQVGSELEMQERIC